MRRSLRRSVIVLVSAALTASACGGGGGGLEIGIRRVALDLAFSEEELAEPVEPRTIVRLVPAPPEVRRPEDLERFRTPPAPPPEPLFPACPEAPPGSVPAQTVTFAVDAPPAAGAYQRHNVGTVDVSGGPFPITLPFPPVTQWQVGTAEQVELPAPLGVGEPTTVTEYEVRKVLTDSFEVVDRLRLRPDRVQLVRRTTLASGATTVFEPEPPVDVYVFGVEGSSWTSAGVDDGGGTAMLFEGRIERREIVDVCGEPVDSYRVVATERVVNLRTGETSGTAEGDPAVYHAATHLGGLVVREDVHTTQTLRDPETGSPVVIELDYVSTVDAVEPRGSG